MSGRSPGRRVAAAPGAALALFLLLLVAFWPVVSGARSFFHMDLYYEHLPVWAATQHALSAGESPFWLEGEYCGHPPLFHQEAPVFYPLTVPLLATGGPVHRLADFFTLLHFWLAGFAVFLLVRDRTERPMAALFGGVAWMLSARMVQSAIWPNAVAVSALVPLGLYGLSRIARGQRRAGTLWASVSGGLALLAARPHVLLAAAPFVVFFAAAMLWSSASWRRALLDFAIAGALALALGAPSWIPSAALLPETSRQAGLSADATDLQPLAQGHELDMVFLPVDGRTRWPESAAYAGVFVGVLFLSGLVVFLRRRAPRARPEFLACVLGAIAGLALAFGAAGPYRYISALPLLRSFRVPERFLFSWSLALAVGSALVLAHWLARAPRPRVMGVLFVLGLAVDLVVHARRAAPTGEAELYTTEPAIVAVLRARLGPDEAGFPRRFLSIAPSLNPVPYPDSVRRELVRNAVSLKGALGLRYGLASAYGAGPTLERVEEILQRPSPRALALSGVGAIVLPGPSATAAPVVEATEALPRAFLVPESVVVPETDSLRVALSPGFDPRRAVVLEEGTALERDPAWNESGTNVRLIARQASRIALEARLSAPGVLVLLDSWEKGWQATVDGVPAPVLRADGAFRGVRLAAGKHRVEFRYVPPGLREGLYLGLAGLLGLALAAIRQKPASDSEGLAPSGF